MNLLLKDSSRVRHKCNFHGGEDLGGGKIVKRHNEVVVMALSINDET